MYTQDLLLIFVTAAISAAICAAVVYVSLRQLIAKIASAIQKEQKAIVDSLQAQESMRDADDADSAKARTIIVSLAGASAVTPGQVRTIQSPVTVPFHPMRLLISNDGQGAQDWSIEGIRIDGRAQFSQAGAVPGDMFAPGVVDGFVSFDDACERIEIDVKYIGADPKGHAFYAAMIGSAKNAGAAHAGA